MPDLIRDVSVIAELKRISGEHSGLLKPEVVVAAAKPRSSPLHDYFTWDDGEAAEKWRLHQARQLISVCVEYIGKDEQAKEQRVFVSLRSDRAEGGYRPLTKVLDSRHFRDQLVKDALEEMRYFREKYETLKELAGVFAAMRRAEQAISGKKNLTVAHERRTAVRR